MFWCSFDKLNVRLIRLQLEVMMDGALDGMESLLSVNLFQEESGEDENSKGSKLKNWLLNSIESTLLNGKNDTRSSKDFCSRLLIMWLLCALFRVVYNKFQARRRCDWQEIKSCQNNTFRMKRSRRRILTSKTFLLKWEHFHNRCWSSMEMMKKWWRSRSLTTFLFMFWLMILLMMLMRV